MAEETQSNSTTTTTTETPPSEADKEKERILNENTALRKQAKEAADRAATAAQELAELKKAGQKSTGDWKTLAETQEAEAKAWREKHDKANSAFVNTLVSSRVREEALKQGFKKDLVDLLDTMEFDEIEASIDNGKFNLKGADVAVSNLKKLRPSLFDSAAAPKFNNGVPTGGTTGTPGLKQAKEEFQAAIKGRFSDPAKYNQAQLNYQKAIFEDRKSKRN